MTVSFLVRSDTLIVTGQRGPRVEADVGQRAAVDGRRLDTECRSFGPAIEFARSSRIISNQGSCITRLDNMLAPLKEKDRNRRAAVRLTWVSWRAQ